MTGVWEPAPPIPSELWRLLEQWAERQPIPKWKDTPRPMRRTDSRDSGDGDEYPPDTSNPSGF